MLAWAGYASAWIGGDLLGVCWIPVVVIGIAFVAAVDSVFSFISAGF
jgi:hypothetical protein